MTLCQCIKYYLCNNNVIVNKVSAKNSSRKGLQSRLCDGLKLHFSGVGELVRGDVIMNTEKYQQILIPRVIPSRKSLMGSRYIFQHDNDPQNIASAVKSYQENMQMKSISQGFALITRNIDSQLVRTFLHKPCIFTRLHILIKVCN